MARNGEKTERCAEGANRSRGTRGERGEMWGRRKREMLLHLFLKYSLHLFPIPPSHSENFFSIPVQNITLSPSLFSFHDDDGVSPLSLVISPQLHVRCAGTPWQLTIVAGDSLLHPPQARMCLTAPPHGVASGANNQGGFQERARPATAARAHSRVVVWFGWHVVVVPGSRVVGSSDTSGPRAPGEESFTKKAS